MSKWNEGMEYAPPSISIAELAETMAIGTKLTVKLYRRYQKVELKEIDGCRVWVDQYGNNVGGTYMTQHPHVPPVV